MFENHKALILSLTPSGESFLMLTVLSPEAGVFYCLKRISKNKPAATASPDLFDTAEIELETSKQSSGARFIRDYRPLHRRTTIGHNYHKLQAASEFCNILTKNAPEMGDYATLYHLAERSLDAFAERATPTIVLLKSVYLLLKDEGYPVRESWWPQVPKHLRQTTKQLLNQPPPDEADESTLQACEAITQNLNRWLQRETDLILP